MPRRPDPIPELLAIGFFAPLVIAARMSRLAFGQPLNGRARQETIRMSVEKPLAVAVGIVDAQTELLARALKFWQAGAMALVNDGLFRNPWFELAAIAVRPSAAKVKQNARRLTRRRRA
jgi:hypothetical protein